ncbi:MAG: hypothetical protein ACYDCO_14565 [Armatimonadota bacterium]
MMHDRDTTVDLLTELTSLADSSGAGFCGVADLSLSHAEIVRQGGEEIGNDESATLIFKIA